MVYKSAKKCNKKTLSSFCMSSLEHFESLQALVKVHIIEILEEGYVGIMHVLTNFVRTQSPSGILDGMVRYCIGEVSLA